MTADDKPLTPAQARQKLQQGLADYLAGKGSEAIVFRLKRTKKASHTYPLKLTQQQRESLLECTQLSRNLKKKIEQAGEGTQIVAVTWNELHKLNDETGRAAVYAASADKKRLMAVISRVIKFFEEEHAEVFNLDAPTTLANTDLLFQFKITLLDITPMIWRRIQVPDCTLTDLHEYIQAAFGWENYHLHQFEIDGVRYSQPAPDGDDFDMEFEDETDVLLSKLLPKSSRKAKWIYEYDFGDGWRHEVLFEGFPPAVPKAKVPLCLEGERACPPEDCGGPPGYADYLAAIADPRHERHEEMLEGRGPFDPEAFDPKKATKQMRKVKPRLPNPRKMSEIIVEMADRLFRNPDANHSSEAAQVALLAATIAWNETILGIPRTSYGSEWKQIEGGKLEMRGEFKLNDVDAMIDELVQFKKQHYPDDQRRILAGSIPNGSIRVEWLPAAAPGVDARWEMTVYGLVRMGERDKAIQFLQDTRRMSRSDAAKRVVEIASDLGIV